MRACNCARASPLQSRTCEGCDIAAAIMSEAGLPFQSTHPRGVRPVAALYRVVCVGVSIHAPAWGATRFVPCSGRGSIVSIHAPAWSATLPLAQIVTQPLNVSIHAPAWGATPTRAPMCVTATGFNPRTRVGCDRRRLFLRRGLFRVSIHAPAWGATDISASENHPDRVSIHAPAWGATAASHAL